MSGTEKRALPEELLSVELLPAEDHEALLLKQYEKLPLAAAAALSAGLVDAPELYARVQKAARTGKGLYQICFQDGALGELMAKRVKGAIHSGLLREVAVAAAAAPLPPAVFAVTATVLTLSRRVDAVRRTQDALSDFLHGQDELRAQDALRTLSETLEGYRTHWDNEGFRTSRLEQVRQIRRSAEQSLAQYRAQADETLHCDPLLHTEQEVQKKLDDVSAAFRCYQLAVSMYAFASFLELVLNEDFSAEHLQLVYRKTEAQSFGYAQCFERGRAHVAALAHETLQGKTMEYMARAKKTAGEAIHKLPLLGASQMDENLIATGARLEHLHAERTEHALAAFDRYAESGAQAFLEKMRTLYTLFHQDAEFLMDEENLYLKPPETPAAL